MTKREALAVNLLTEIWTHHRLNGIAHCDSCKVRLFQLLKSYDVLNAAFGHAEEITVDFQALRSLTEEAINVPDA